MTAGEKPRTRLLPLWAKVLVGFFLLALMVLGTVQILGRATTRQWDQFLQAVRDRGQPVTFEEIEARRARVPPEDNSAEFIATLVREFGAESDGAAPLDVLFIGDVKSTLLEGVPRYAIAPSREHLETRRELLLRLDPLLQKPRGRLDLDLTQSIFDIALPELTFIRELGKTCALATTIALIDGQSEDAVKYIQLQFRLAGSLDEHPTLIGRLVQMSITALASQSIEQSLRVGVLNTEAVGWFEAEITHRLQVANLKWAMVGERAFFISVSEMTLSGLQHPAAGVGSSGPGWRMPTWIVRKNQLKGAEMLSRLVEAADDERALLRVANEVETEVDGLGRFYHIVDIIMPSLQRAVTLHLKNTAHLRATHAALAAERFRMDNGSLPDSLNTLVPDYLAELPIDPFDGQPMRFQSDQEGITVYSIDENLLDDGGDVYATPDGKSSADVGFRLLRPEFRQVVILEQANAP